MRRQVWVVESGDLRWRGVQIEDCLYSRKQAKPVMKDLSRYYPGRKFRITKYEAVR